MEGVTTEKGARPKELGAEGDFSDKKTQFVKLLRKKYKNLCREIFPAMFLHENLGIDTLYVESEVKFLEYKQEGEQQNTWTTLQNYKMIFTDPRIKSKRRIIGGEEYSGKSTLALKMTHDWCEGIEQMVDFEVLILLHLRQFQKVQTVYSAIRKFLLPRDCKLTEDDIKRILDNSLTVVLLDDYNKYPGRGNKDTDIERIMKGDMFQNHEVVLLTIATCQPLDPISDTKKIWLSGVDDVARYKYILNKVGCGDSVKAKEINGFIKNNPVTAVLCDECLFFVIISHMVKGERSQDFKTWTDVFEHVITCFHNQEERSGTAISRKDHSKLDRTAFQALRGNPQKINWDDNELRGKIGGDLYDEYVKIGILREEEVFDDDFSDYKKETRFLHKLFAEWYAAHYLANEAPWPKAGSEPIGPSTLDQTSETTQLRSANGEDVQWLSTIDVKYVHFMCRFACGLNKETALKIIKYSGTDVRCYYHTLSCIAEWMKKWGGSLETIEDKVTKICSDTLYIFGSDSVEQEKTTLELMEFASNRKIPIRWMELQNCLNVGPHGILRVKPTNLPLPVTNTPLGVLWIWERGREITKVETESILRYSSMCLAMEELWFRFTPPPRYHCEEAETISALRSKNVRVQWFADDFTSHILNLESGKWESSNGRTTT